jgi:hypothetical protein
MFDRIVNKGVAESLLGEPEGGLSLDSAESAGIISRVGADSSNTAGYLVMDLVKLQLSQSLSELGVDREKAYVYADAVLSARKTDDQGDIRDWVKEDGDDLYCLIADKQLSRIFLRSSVTGRETDIGAVKPVLLPSTNCEINVTRVIRPFIKKAKQALSD